MLASTYRLSKQDIERVFKKGHKRSNNFLTVLALPSKTPTNRFCIIVTAKLLPKAVQRNRIRRMVYEIIRKNFQTIPFAFDLIILIKSPFLSIKNHPEREQILLDSLVNFLK